LCSLGLYYPGNEYFICKKNKFLQTSATTSTICLRQRIVVGVLLLCTYGANMTYLICKKILHTTLRRFCVSNFCVAVGPAFTFSDFDRVGGRGFAFDVFCVTHSFGFELLALPSVALLFDRGWIENNPKRLKIKHV